VLSPRLYYERGSNGGNLDSQIGIYKDAEDGACEVSMFQEEDWKDRAVYKILVHNSKFEIDFGN